MRKLKVTSLSQSGKVAYNLAGERFYIPERLRSTIAVGQYMLVDTRHYQQSAKLDEAGVPVIQDGKPVYIDQPFSRVEVIFTGDNQSCVAALYEEKITAAVDEKLVAALIQAEVSTVTVPQSVAEAIL